MTEGKNMNGDGILVFFHCRSNTGYAIGRLETVFFEMAQRLTGDSDRIHFGYSSLDGGWPAFLTGNFRNVIRFDTMDSSKKNHDAIHDYICENNIRIAFGFDQPVFRPVYSVMRRAGVRLFVSYWGAPMSSINHGVKLLFKRLEVGLIRNKPDHFIFESRAMADSAVYGRGVKLRKVSIVNIGVDTEKFKPAPLDRSYAHEVFTIPKNRRIIFYSGHMEERKGVHVIVEAANELIRVRKKNDVHFLFLGNKYGEQKRFFPMYSGTETEKYITFGGYRDDISRILSSCYTGVIASTGWDSFTMSSLEIAASGLPLIVSYLQGLVETIKNGKTGYYVEPGDYIGLADKIEQLLNNSELQKTMGTAAREWILEKFSRERQIESLTATMQGLYSHYY
ncbi:MAG: glycosyltransferase family 4 protein [Desulfuromonadaceae bacterium]|nr:glycosyltransferase family 4 protein [Desulfuromonadaceae bacterium]